MKGHKSELRQDLKQIEADPIDAVDERGRAGEGAASAPMMTNERKNDVAGK